MMSAKIDKNNSFARACILCLMLIGCSSCASTSTTVPVDDERGVVHTQYDNELIENEFRNDSDVQTTEEQIKIDSENK